MVLAFSSESKYIPKDLVLISVGSTVISLISLSLFTFTFKGSAEFLLTKEVTSFEIKTYLSFIDTISSPGNIPAFLALYPSVTVSTVLEEKFPIHAITTKYTNNPKIILTNPPAATIAILLGIDCLEKDLSSSDLSSSPNILTNPPKGTILIEYVVSPFCFETSFFPNPIENSFTFTLKNLATRK